MDGQLSQVICRLRNIAVLLGCDGHGWGVMVDIQNAAGSIEGFPHWFGPNTKPEQIMRGHEHCYAALELLRSKPLDAVTWSPGKTCPELFQGAAVRAGEYMVSVGGLGHRYTEAIALLIPASQSWMTIADADQHAWTGGGEEIYGLLKERLDPGMLPRVTVRQAS